MSAVAQARLDLARLVASKRWIVVVLVWSAIALFATEQLVVRSEASGLMASAWDVRLVAVNNWMYVSYMLLISFVFLVGDTVAADRSLGWCASCLARMSSPAAWWAGKALFIAGAAMLYQSAFLIFTVLFGMARGLPMALGASELLRAPLEPGALFAPLGPGADLATRLAISVGHEVLGFWAIALVLVALTARSTRPASAVAFAFILVVIDWVLAQRLQLWELLSPGRRLLESIHYQVPGMAGGSSWLSTFAYMAVLLALGLLIGSATARRLEY